MNILWLLGTFGLFAFAAQRGCDWWAARQPPANLGKLGPEKAVIENPAPRERRIFWAALELLPAPRQDGIGTVESPYVIRFLPEHFLAGQQRYVRSVDDLVLKAGEQLVIVPQIVDASRAGQHVYGRLVLYYGSPDPQQCQPLACDPLWVPVIPP